MQEKNMSPRLRDLVLVALPKILACVALNASFFRILRETGYTILLDQNDRAWLKGVFGLNIHCRINIAALIRSRRISTQIIGCVYGESFYSF
ncbi:hypothetical protein CCP2SC5_720001 [Azospirillaceae bacterium]